jgi:proline dehydrogenase
MIYPVPVAAAPRRLLFALATSAGWERAVRALPGGERSAYRLARRYVAGKQLQDAFACARRLAAEGLASSIDFFGESVSDPIQADRVADDYVAVAQTLDQAPQSTFLSIDLSHIGLDEPGEAVQRRLQRIAAALPEGRRLQVGAEEERRADGILAAVLAVARSGGAVSATVQANLKRSRTDANALAEVEFPRFRGHLTTCAERRRERSSSATYPSRLSTAVPARGRRTGPQLGPLDPANRR